MSKYKRTVALEPQAQTPPIETPAAPIVSQTPDMRYFWPPDRPLPDAYVTLRHAPLPCRYCRRLLLDSGAQAVVCLSTRADVAYFRCRACERNFALPRRETEERSER